MTNRMHEAALVLHSVVCSSLCMNAYRVVYLVQLSHKTDGDGRMSHTYHTSHYDCNEPHMKQHV